MMLVAVVVLADVDGASWEEEGLVVDDEVSPG